MKTIKDVKTLLINTKKKAFTLIELLIVVAIIGILAGVGIPMYNGYMATARVESSRSNDQNIKSFVAGTLTKCAAGSQEVLLGATTINCQGRTLAGMRNAFVTYFNAINTNAHTPNAAQAVASNAAVPALGATNIGMSANPDTIMIRTNVGNEDGGNVVTVLANIRME